MHKYLIIFLVLVSASVRAGIVSDINNDTIIQPVQSLNYPRVDSLTYQYYWLGKWDDLINTGKEALNQQIDFKRLRQRIGYAFFQKGDYYSAMKQYEAALAFDKSDIDTQLYLYYCGLNTGNDSYSKYFMSKFPEETKKWLGNKSFKILDAVDLEYNYKMNDYPNRHNPKYFKIGLSTKISNRLSLYQSVSTFSQNVDSTGISQKEYYAGINWVICPKVDMTIAYHYLYSTSIDSITYRVLPPVQGKRLLVTTNNLQGNLLFAKISTKLSNFDFTGSASVLNYNNVTTQQFALQAGVSFTGKLNLHLKSQLDYMFDNILTRLIYTQSVSFLLSKNLWTEGSITFGNLKNYADLNGLYVFNADDPTIFKSGLSLIWSVAPNISLVGNYTYNQKNIEPSTRVKNSTNYNQHSLSGGIIWKL